MASQAPAHTLASRRTSRTTGRKSTPAREQAMTVAAHSISSTSDVSSKVAVNPLAVKVATLVEAFGSQAKLAEFLEVSRTQPGKWMKLVDQPNPTARRLIHDVEFLWSRLVEDRTPELARLWLESPNAFLDGTTPLNWLHARGPEAAVAAGDAEAAGSYA